jgi:peptidoglycan-associated lipoprotein
MKSWTLAVVLTACIAGCAAKPLPPAQEVAQNQNADATPGNASAQATEQNESNVAVAEDIRKACGINDSEAFFAYNSASVRGREQPVLKKLASCFTSGPLKGREMRLVGHADPRGDEGYNYVLGQRRADNVKSAIVSAGMAAGRVSTVSRGENEATGADETGWAKDRRVDVLLGT